MAYDVMAIRRDFPILSREVYGKPLVYLDNAASAQKPKPVLDAMNKAYVEEYANVHRGLHYLSNAATQAFEDARESVRRLRGRDHLHAQRHRSHQFGCAELRRHGAGRWR
jgi:cysteine desulfurase/selenocysteine lyase